MHSQTKRPSKQVYMPVTKLVHDDIPPWVMERVLERVDAREKKQQEQTGAQA